LACSFLTVAAAAAAAGVAPVLCQQISKRCEGKQYSVDSGSDDSGSSDSSSSSGEGLATTAADVATDEL
jgi:hypothetical protein